MEKSEGSLRRKSMNPVSPLFEKIDASIEKKANLFENSFSRYAVRAVLACLFLTLGTAVAFAIAMEGGRYRARSRKDFIRIYVQLGAGHDSIHERRIRNIEYALYDRGCFSAETCFK